MDVSEAVLNAIYFLYNPFCCCEKLVKNFGSGGTLLTFCTATFVAPIGICIPSLPSLAQAALIFPVAGADNFVDHRAIVPWGVTEQPGSGPRYSIGREFTGMFLDKLLNC